MFKLRLTDILREITLAALPVKSHSAYSTHATSLKELLDINVLVVLEEFVQNVLAKTTNVIHG